MNFGGAAWNWRSGNQDRRQRMKQFDGESHGSILSMKLEMTVLSHFVNDYSNKLEMKRVSAFHPKQTSSPDTYSR